MRLGIDFGTTRTVVAAVDSGRYPIAVFDTPRGFTDYLPGLAFSTPRGLEFGWAPTDQESRLALRSIKRLVGSLAPDELVPGLDPAPAALDLATDYLRFVHRMLFEQSNLDLSPDEPLEVMAAVPANANTGQRYITVEALTRAGFKVMGLLNEPTAAAIEFAYRSLGAIGRRSPKRYVVVYDLGGGTFDTSAVSLAGRRFELLRSEGIGALGGDDLDAVILDVVMESLGRRADELDISTRSLLLERCREAKETLHSSSRRLLVEVDGLLPPDWHQGKAGQVVIDAEALYERCAPLVDRTLALLAKVFSSLEGYGIDPNNPRELGAVYLVGGATAFPSVGRALRREYKRKIQLAPQPHAATAVGLAIACDPGAEVFVREAATRHFGVWREGDGGRLKLFDPIIPKNMTPPEQEPIVIKRHYQPAHPVGHLRYLECTEVDEQGQPAGDLTPWGEMLFPYAPELAAVQDLGELAVARCDGLHGEQIVETYCYGPDGSISIEIENTTRGYSRQYVVPWRRGLR